MVSVEKPPSVTFTHADGILKVGIFGYIQHVFIVEYVLGVHLSVN